ncbi:hypothetical protein N0B51_01065 [Tsuneonella sp. YG55]|uniref:PilZ domain-containing protein n=1 Tax=Tsuneonella litorea TaxID=2976475 RepID=A0A9X2VYB6_9SPHN|nr:hypothetical protein [Tsuneonella litorea]MCT2557562.1 hypothetical protein [Tsuneonella litorea]
MRHSTSLEGQLKSSRGARQAVGIVDLSTHGFNASLQSRPLAGGTGFSLKIGGLEMLGAEVCWANCTNAGFRFDRPLHPAVLDHVVRSHPPEASDT